jgi:hypothetical protein
MTFKVICGFSYRLGKAFFSLPCLITHSWNFAVFGLSFSSDDAQEWIESAGLKGLDMNGLYDL